MRAFASSRQPVEISRTTPAESRYFAVYVAASMATRSTPSRPATTQPTRAAPAAVRHLTNRSPFLSKNSPSAGIGFVNALRKTVAISAILRRT
ncbi:MAG: hypothetical protein ACRC1K_11315 [Planctomycetia bacterium]